MCHAQGDIATFAELIARGLTRRGIERRVRSGQLTPVRRGVYATARACAPALTAAAHGGRLACVSAAAHLGLFVIDDVQVHVGMGAHGRSRPHPECACRLHWDDPAASSAFGLPTVPHMLRQILGCRGLESFFVALESALNQRLITPVELEWLSENTNDAARDAIAFARSDAGSGLESLLRWRLRSWGAALRSQVRIVSVGIVDFLIGERLIVEVDGRVNHDGQSMRHKDLLRDANAAAWGYVTLRFDYAMVVHDWETVEAAILGQLAAGRHQA